MLGFEARPDLPLRDCVIEDNAEHKSITIKGGGDFGEVNI